MSPDHAGWEQIPLNEVLDFREGPGIMARDFRDHGVPLIRLAGLKRGASILDGCNYLDPQMVGNRWNHFRVGLGDVLLSTSASLGEVAVVDEAGVGAIPYTGIIRFRPAGDRIIPEFLQFALTAPTFKRQIEEMGVGSVMRHFGPTHLVKMTVALPPVAVQAAVAGVLGALDEKIAANDRIIDVADQLRTLTLRRWEESNGEMAEYRPLSSFAGFVNGRAFTKDATGTGRMVIRIAEINSGPGLSTVHNDIDVLDVHLARPGDVLFAWSGSLAVARWYRPEAIVNQHIFKVIPNPGVPAWLAYELVKAKLADFKGIAAGKATTMGHIQRHHLDEPVLAPRQEGMASLNPELGPLWDRALVAEQESLALARLRDTLLPGLMSGEIRVRDAERIVEDAT